VFSSHFSRFPILVERNQGLGYQTRVFRGAGVPPAFLDYVTFPRDRRRHKASMETLIPSRSRRDPNHL
jgi:hypothetical protein